jgi:fructuronate reductase
VAVTTVRLGDADLARLPSASRPLVRGSQVGIVHIGLGAFHRAHQAVYTEEALAAAGGDWGIVGVAPRSRDTLDALVEQNGLFSVATLADDSAEVRVVGSIVGALHAAADSDAVLALLASPQVRVVTLTVTEKAYLVDAAGRPVPSEELRADLCTDRAPRTIPGLLARALRLRASAGGPPLALVSCDNLPSNGRRLRAILEHALGDALPSFVSCPSTMVDRIVPAATSATLDRARAALGLVDLAAVEAEPFRQWVLEDDFPGGRPAWERAGAVLSSSAGEVAAYERLKLRMLNGSHSTVAYLGALAGRATIAEAVRLPGMTEFLMAMLCCDVVPTLRPPSSVDAVAYAESVLERFANPAIGHRTLQVAMDGSQKLPQRLFASLVERRAAGAEPVGLATGLAAWIRFVGGVADDGSALELDDPLAPVLRAALAAAGPDPRSRVCAILRTPVAPPGLAEDAVLVELVADRLAALDRDGAAATLARMSRP